LDATHTFDESNTSSELPSQNILHPYKSDFSKSTISKVYESYEDKYLIGDRVYSIAFFKRVINFLSRRIFKFNFFKR
jgi:hypothetical protein